MAQSLAQILLHLVFSTKARYKFLADPEIRGQMHAYLTAVFKTYKSPSLEVGGTADHIHALCSLSKTLSVAELIEDVKKAIKMDQDERRPVYQVSLADRVWGILGEPLPSGGRPTLYSKPGTTPSADLL